MDFSGVIQLKNAIVGQYDFQEMHFSLFGK